MKERPIIFSGEQVRALLDGTKTQTRRIAPIDNIEVTPHADGMTTWSVNFSKPVKGALGTYSGTRCTTAEAHNIIASQYCRYGSVGDRLWVRETFIHEPADYCWEASVSIPCSPATTVYRADYEGDTHGGHWTPSIYMPRRASRITLEITDVRVQRLQDISDADAQAEGITDSWPEIECNSDRPYRDGYRWLWESINGAGSWSANPWVWALTFRRVQP